MLNLEEIKTRARVISFCISLIYVGLGTISLFLAATSPKIFAENEFVQVLILLILLVTFPASIISFGVLYAGGDNVKLIAFGVQVIVFLIFWFSIYRYFVTKYKRSEAHSSPRSPER